MKKNKKNKGFTLFELLVSISIIGILTALAVVSYSGAQKKARDARRVEDVKVVQTAAEQFYSQNNYSYPTSTATPWVGGGQNILDAFPKDPKTGVNYDYAYTAATNSYCVCATVENVAMSNASDITTCNIGTTSSANPLFCTKSQQ